MPTDVLWIGLNDQRSTNLFEWSDHSQVTFTQWETDEPSHTTNLQEDCVLIRGKVASPNCPSRDRQCVMVLMNANDDTCGPCRMGNGPTTCVRRHMVTSVRRRLPLDQVQVPQRKPNQAANLWVMQFALNGGYNNKRLIRFLILLIYCYYLLFQGLGQVWILLLQHRVWDKNFWWGKAGMLRGWCLPGGCGWQVKYGQKVQ